ncbi:MAG: efflux RND transporter permease subunit [Paracoccaceae bacterium]
MTRIVDWATAHARMVIALVLLSIGAGAMSYIGLPKEGEPDIDIPALFVSAFFPGISAEDSEKLLIRPLETKLRDLDGLKKMSATAAEGYAGVALEFEFGWDRAATLAEVRDRVNQAEAQMPDGVDQILINEINFSEFPILVVSLSGAVPERTLLRTAKNLQRDLEALPPVLEAGLAGHRDEMLEVLIDPLKLEAYNVTAGELINVVTRNNQLIAAGELESGSGAYSVKIPSAFNDPKDVYNLPVKVNGDRVITLSEIAEIRLTFEDQRGTARYNGEKTVALQIVKRKGFNVIETAALVRQTVAKSAAEWPPELREAIAVSTSMDTSKEVASMVNQLQASVLTAIALVMIVVLSALGTRAALLVGFAIPTSFLLCFALLAVFGMAISNIVMFGLILAVGMLVDGAIVVVEYADKRISQGQGPMRAYDEAACRMFWPIVSSTATTLCAFLPMLFWPGVAGEFMGNLPVTLIFVLSASLIVALVFLPVIGGVAGRLSAILTRASGFLHENCHIFLRLLLVVAAAAVLFAGIMAVLRGQFVPGPVLFVVGCFGLAVAGGSVGKQRSVTVEETAYRRSRFGSVIHFISGNPIMPFVAIGLTVFFIGFVFSYFSAHNNGVEFFVETEPERAIAYVRARGNLSLAEKDRLVRQAEAEIAGTDGVRSIFAFAGTGGLNQNNGGNMAPVDAVGQVLIELAPWQERRLLGKRGKGGAILAEINEKLSRIPGVIAEISEQAMGPAEGKPVHLRLRGQNWQDLLDATRIVRGKFDRIGGLTDIEDSRPLPGIDWQIDVDVEKAGRYGADVATVGAMVQLVTRGLMLDTMRTDTSDEEIDIRVRLPEEDRLLSTLDTLRVRTADGLVPLSNFIERKPVPKLGKIDRFDSQRRFDVKAGLAEGVNANDKIAELTAWLEDERPLPAGISYEWTGEQQDQAESLAFLQKAFLGALGLMFVILLAQFNSFYNAVLVLSAVVMSVTGVLIGMLVMGQTFSVIMTGTGIVALAGIVVNNNIVLIDTYQEYARYMPRLEAIVRTAEARIRPVLLTTITTMAGLTPMMLGISVDFINGGISWNSPTSLWWKQLATAVVFGLGLATVLTLVVTPAMLSIRVWFSKGAYGSLTMLLALTRGRDSAIAQDLALRRKAAKEPLPEITWGEDQPDQAPPPSPIRAVE